jgi:hypothetical protein
MGGVGDRSQGPQAELANLLGVIERAAGDLALAEEPARFVAALEGEAGEDEPA